MSFYYLRADDIRVINEAFCGPGAGIRDRDGFLGIVERPQQTFVGRDLFVDVFAKAAAYLHGFATTQYFLDGNKRTGFLSSTVFLGIHNWQWIGPSVDDAESFLLDVAANKIDQKAVAVWLREHSVPRLLSAQLSGEGSLNASGAVSPASGLSGSGSLSTGASGGAN